jgi:hypothetical protein
VLSNLHSTTKLDDVFEARPEAGTADRKVQRLHAVRRQMPSLGQQVGERAAVGMDLDVCRRLGPGGSLVLKSEDRCAVYLGDELIGRLLDREVLLVRVEAAPQVDLQPGEVLPLDREWYVGDDLGSVVGIRDGDVDVSAEHRVDEVPDLLGEAGELLAKTCLSGGRLSHH